MHNDANIDVNQVLVLDAILYSSMPYFPRYVFFIVVHAPGSLRP